MFAYSAAAQEAGTRPLPGFPRLDREYRSQALWPFFALRIPPLARADVRARLKALGIDPGDEISLLGALGAVVATSPYILETWH